jgi:hypothetical protein
MAYKVTIDHPSAGESDILIQGLGTFPNHSETVVSNFQVRMFQHANSRVDSTTDSDGKVTYEPSIGEHPVDLDIYGVRFEKVDDSQLPQADTESTGAEES